MNSTQVTQVRLRCRISNRAQTRASKCLRRSPNRERAKSDWKMKLWTLVLIWRLASWIRVCIRTAKNKVLPTTIPLSYINRTKAVCSLHPNHLQPRQIGGSWRLWCLFMTRKNRLNHPRTTLRRRKWRSSRRKRSRPSQSTLSLQPTPSSRICQAPKSLMTLIRAMAQAPMMAENASIRWNLPHRSLQWSGMLA